MAAFVESSNYSHVLQKGAAVVSTLEDRADGPHPSIQTKQVTACRINQLQINGFINQNTGVANFLNVPYARIPARFCEATLIDPRKEIGVIEAVRYGPCCPQPFDVIHDMTGHLYPKKIDITNSSEFACLSVNIYAPPSAVGSRNRLPVTAWIHGGAFTYGDASDEYGEQQKTSSRYWTTLTQHSSRWQLHRSTLHVNRQTCHSGHHELPRWALWFPDLKGD